MDEFEKHLRKKKKIRSIIARIFVVVICLYILWDQKDNFMYYFQDGPVSIGDVTGISSSKLRDGAYVKLAGIPSIRQMVLTIMFKDYRCYRLQGSPIVVMEPVEGKGAVKLASFEGRGRLVKFRNTRMFKTIKRFFNERYRIDLDEIDPYLFEVNRTPQTHLKYVILYVVFFFIAGVNIFTIVRDI